MCGRYVVTTPGEVLAQIFGAEPPPEEVLAAIVPRYNVSPTQQVPIVRGTARGSRELALVTWGLVPHWAKDPGIGNKLINARADTAAEKPSFRDSLKRRRCLLPADGFYEWKKLAKGKEPWLFRMRDSRPFALAGLWSSWKNPETNTNLETCTILTTTPNELVSTVHDRMPVILPPAHQERWLDTGAESTLFTELFLPFSSDEMEAFPVSRRVNSPANEGPENIEPVSPAVS
jgi:putative SOS response-associated peptidase YedK